MRRSGQSLIFSGLSEAGRTIAVLPIRFSHCRQPSSEETPGRMGAGGRGAPSEWSSTTQSGCACHGLPVAPSGARCLSEGAALVPAAEWIGGVLAVNPPWHGSRPSFPRLVRHNAVTSLVEAVQLSALLGLALEGYVHVWLS